jgi:DNA-binding Lrp family transcriptional regulator
MWKSSVIQAHRPESDEFIACSAGDIVEFERKETAFPGWIWCTDSSGSQAWVPEAYVSTSEDKCRFVREYISKELEVEEGEIVLTLEVVSGWALVLKEGDEKGWVPLSCLASATQDQHSG